jgi:hypothetical protein
MERRSFERKPLGQVDLDMCFACRAIWFDQFESAQLTPGAVIGLFRMIHEHQDQPLRPIGDMLRCPACHDKLALTHDFQRSGRISYYRCPRSDGRLSTFFQFMREKEFVRDLTTAEIERLKATVKQVRCSSCGAPIDLGRDAQCGYCRAPISILDTDVVKKTIAELDARERGRHIGDPQEVVDGLLSGKPGRRFDGPVDPEAALEAVLARERGGKPRRSQPMRYPPSTPPGRADGGEGFNMGIVDLVSDALDFLTTD